MKFIPVKYQTSVQVFLYLSQSVLMQQLGKRRRLMSLTFHGSPIINSLELSSDPNYGPLLSSSKHGLSIQNKSKSASLTHWDALHSPTPNGSTSTTFSQDSTQPPPTINEQNPLAKLNSNSEQKMFQSPSVLTGTKLSCLTSLVTCTSW